MRRLLGATVTAFLLLAGCQGILGIQDGTVRQADGGAASGGQPDAGDASGTGGTAGSGGTVSSGGNVGTGGAGGTGAGGAAGTAGSGGAGTDAGGAGGSVNACQPSGMTDCTAVDLGTASCNACGHGACCSAITDCINDPACDELMTCIANKCATITDQTAFNNCVALNCSTCATSSAQTLYSALGVCVSNNCSTECSASPDGGPPTTLGARCTSDTDCNGLVCATPTSSLFGAGGPSRGYCTTPCSATADCTPFDSSAQCVAVGGGASTSLCLEGCSGSSGDCRGRYDSLCMPVGATGDAGTSAIACTPFCASDADCNGDKCDPRTGLCTNTPTTGFPIGSDCDPSAIADGGADPCAGVCLASGNSTGLCSAICDTSSLGNPGACGSNPMVGSQQDAACLYTLQLGNVNVGACAQLCSCDGDCHGSGYKCETWTQAGMGSQASQLAQAFHQAGFCVTSTTTDQSGNPVPGIPCSTDGGP